MCMCRYFSICLPTMRRLVSQVVSFVYVSKELRSFISLQRTGQEVFLFVDADEVPGILVGIRNVCAISSILLGNVSGANGELTPSHSTSAPASTGLPSNAEIDSLPPRWEILPVLVTISAVLHAYRW